MTQSILKVLKCFSNGSALTIILKIISTWLMRNGIFSLSLWLVKHTHASKSAGIYAYKSMASWVDKYGGGKLIYPQRSLTLNPVIHIGYQNERNNDMHRYTHDLILPPVSLNTLKQVDVIGGSELVFTNEGTVLYDELAFGDINRYGGKESNIVPRGYFQPYLPAGTNEYILCMYQLPSPPVEITCAISLLKDHSSNYYHWLLECLPRAILALKNRDWDIFPLLIDEGLPAQFVESLRLLSLDRELITLPYGLRVHVKELLFPSVISQTHDYYGKSPRSEDFLIAPEAIFMLREAFLPHVLSGDDELLQPYIYIARSGGSHRAITNEEEVINVVRKMGFTVVYPGKLRFIEQVTLFSNAKIIIGPTGAGMANIIFSPADCKIIVLAAATTNANYYLFAQLAQYIGQSITYVNGKPAKPNEIHSDYEVDKAILQKLIPEYIECM